MTGFQSNVAEFMGFGVPGELFLDGPFRGQPGIIDSAGPNTVGFAFTQVAGSPGHFTVGGTGVFGGILANPKEYALFGTTAGSLEPTLNLLQYSNGAFVDMGELIVNLTSAGNIGDTVDYVNATGALVARAPSYPASGAQRIAFASNIATVTLTPAGAPAIGVGSRLVSADGQTATVSAVLTGTGGNGTYTVSTVADHAAQAFSFTSVAAAGNTNIARSELTRYNTTDTASNGLSVVKITQ